MIMTDQSKNIAIFASGNGTNAINILDCAKEELFNSTIKCLITDKKDAGIIVKINTHPVYKNIPIYTIPFVKKIGESHPVAKARHEVEIKEILDSHHVNWIALAGYMKILSAKFLKCYFDESFQKNRVINIHPSLLPKYPGKDAYEQAFNSGDEVSGVTIHHVDSGIDTGPIILQKTFKRKKEDTFEDFKNRGLSLEYQIYREALVSLDWK